MFSWREADVGVHQGDAWRFRIVVASPDGITEINGLYVWACIVRSRIELRCKVRAHTVWLSESYGGAEHLDGALLDALDKSITFRDS